MIAVDTSAIIAILLREPEAEACITAIGTQDSMLISAATLAETLIVASRQDLRQEAIEFVEGLSLEVVPVTAASARRSAEAYARWGKGVHPARLNYGDCFAYELAKDRDCPLLFIGNDFAQTDIESALA
jgi:ribonuclease VapC